MSMGLSTLMVALGGALGCTLRWWLAVALNGLMPQLPMGTLVANWLGGYLAGVLAALFMLQTSWPEAWRLFLITGLLGGLTTFSTFSLEAVALLQRQLWLPALAHVSLHLGGALLLTVAGFVTVNLLAAR